MSKQLRIFVVIVSFVFGSVSLSYGLNAIPTAVLHGQTQSTSQQTWMTVPWYGNETPYVRTENTIDDQISNGFSLPALQAQYMSQANQQPKNPVAQFARAYCNEQCLIKFLPVSDSDELSTLKGLEQTDPTHIYELTRERFIWTVICRRRNNSDDNRYLDPLGRRLLAKNTRDWNVRWHLFEAIEFWKDRQNECLILAQEWVKEEPGRSLSHLALAHAEDSIWSYSYGYDAEAGQDALNQYQIFLNTANPNDPRTKLVPFTVNAMHGYMTGKYQWPKNQ